MDDFIVLPVKLEPREQDVPAASQERILESIVDDTIDVEIINEACGWTRRMGMFKRKPLNEVQKQLAWLKGTSETHVPFMTPLALTWTRRRMGIFKQEVRQ